MTNEELATAIKGGGTELTEQLYANVLRFIAKLANKWLVAFDNGRGVEFCDLMNCGYIALVEAVEWWSPDGEQSFLGALAYALKTQFCEAYGVRTPKQAKDPLHNAESFSRPITEDGETTLGELLEDPQAGEALEAIEERDYQASLHEALEKALLKLPEPYNGILKRRFYRDQSFVQLGAEYNVSPSYAQQLAVKALRKLRRLQEAQPLVSFMDFDYYHGTGLRSYERTMTSIQERYVMNMEQAEHRAQSMIREAHRISPA